LDLVHTDVCAALGKTKEDFNLAKMLQGGTWTAGRKLAAKLRPETNKPPISILSTGTVF
jgi:hypothetical protein